MFYNPLACFVQKRHCTALQKEESKTSVFPFNVCNPIVNLISQIIKRLFFLLTVAGVLNNSIAGCLQNRVLTLHFKLLSP